MGTVAPTAGTVGTGRTDGRWSRRKTGARAAVGKRTAGRSTAWPTVRWPRNGCYTVTMTGWRRTDRCTVGKRPDKTSKRRRRGRVAPNTGKPSTGPGKPSTGSGKKRHRSIGTSTRSGTNLRRSRGNRSPGSTIVVGTVRSCTIAAVGTVDKSLKNEIGQLLVLGYH